ncbi:MAG: aminopeptidase P family protein [Hydrotalea sp.]|nr:aminopeptidase P family protein [Hydrotalea sp.]
MMLEKLRRLLPQHKLDGWLQNRSDIFLNEYSRASDNFLTPLTGFTGSTGLAMVLMDAAFLLVDGRYDVQAAAEVDKQWRVIGPKELRAQQLSGAMDFLIAHHKKNSARPLRLGFPSAEFSHQQITNWQKKLIDSNITLQPVAQNLVKSLLATLPQTQMDEKTTPRIFDHDMEFAGESRGNKIKIVAEKIAAKNLDGFFIGDNANLSWLLNLRGDIIPYNPIVTGFGFVESNQRCTLFLPDELLAQGFDKNLIACYPMNQMNDFFKQWRGRDENKNKKIGLHDQDCSHAVVQSVGGEKTDNLVFTDDPITRLKAIKNKTEVAGARAAHIADGIAMVNFLHWLESEIASGGLHNKKIDEKIMAEKLWWFRRQDKNCIAPSFETIPALSENAALPHYQTTAKTNRVARVDDIFLLDSGAHYFFGTTDITRTICLTPRALIDNKWGDDFAEHYVRVLKGNLAIARARFPLGISGGELDPLARQFLWAAGRDYNHGTGHGIGSFLPVHEGPQYISGRSHEPFADGMITSNEPGFYHSQHGVGVYGIRIENVELCVAVANGDDGAVLGFETLTLCPIDTTPIFHKNNLAMLTVEEKKQFNDYHQKVYDQLSPHLSPLAKNWLRDKTKAI